MLRADRVSTYPDDTRSARSMPLVSHHVPAPVDERLSEVGAARMSPPGVRRAGAAIAGPTFRYGVDRERKDMRRDRSPDLRYERFDRVFPCRAGTVTGSQARVARGYRPNLSAYSGGTVWAFHPPPPSARRGRARMRASPGSLLLV